MTTKQAQKERTHQQIIAAAGAMFREAGYKPTRIDHIMDSIGLTVGGFYNHFDSKDGLLREVVDSTVSFAVEADDPNASEPAHRLEEILDMYLSQEHRDHPAGGCIVPCLSAEIARANDEVRDAYSAFINRIVDKLATQLEPKSDLTARERATATVAMLVGALLIARAVNDEETSNQFLNATREAARQV
jgi:TetR/AcrR family transcriptional repressor of nem operon